MTDKIFLLGNILALAAQETDTDLLDLVYTLLASCGAEREEVSA